MACSPPCCGDAATFGYSRLAWPHAEGRDAAMDPRRGNAWRRRRSRRPRLQRSTTLGSNARRARLRSPARYRAHALLEATGGVTEGGIGNGQRVLGANLLREALWSQLQQFIT